MTKIVVDSGCDLPEEFNLWYPDIEVVSVPLTLTIDGQHYIDDDKLDVYAYLEHSERSPKGPTTAAPSPQLFLDAFDVDSGSAKEAENIFVITISSKLSASFESACLAARMRAEQVKGSLTHVFDSLSASVGEAQIALRVAELVKRNLPEIEIIEHVEKFISSMNTFFILDNFDTPVKNGRMSRTVATMAEFLNIKPLCEGLHGEMKVIYKARNYQRAIKQMVKILKSRVDDFSDRVLAISHVQAYDKAVATQADLLAEMDFQSSFIVPTGGLCTTYASRGGLIFTC